MKGIIACGGKNNHGSNGIVTVTSQTNKKNTLLPNVQWKPQIRPFFSEIWKRKRPSNIVEFCKLISSD